MDGLSRHTWPATRLGEAIEGLARRTGLRGASCAPVRLPPRPDDAVLDRSVGAAARQAGLEAEAVTGRYGAVGAFLRTAAPALVRVEVAGETRFLALLSGRARHAVVLAPDLGLRRVSLDDVGSALCADLERPVAGEVDRMMAAAGLGGRGRTRAALLRERLGGLPVGGIWLLQLPPSAPFGMQLRRAGLVRGFGALLTTHVLQHAMWVLSWYVVGLAALRGRLDAGWLAAWVLLLATLIPLRLRGVQQQGRLAVRAGTLLRRRLMLGALKLDLDAVRHQGAGQLLGRILESNALEVHALQGGYQGLVAVLELAVAAVVLGLGAGGWPQAALLGAWVALAAALALRLHRRETAATVARLDLTHRLVERMVGHRTRLAQQRPDRRHADEDREAERYLSASADADRSEEWMLAFVPRGWLVVGVSALAPAFVAGGSHGLGLALGLGGVLLAYQALRRLAFGAAHLSEALLAWHQVADLFDAAGRPDERAAAPSLPDAAAPHGPLPTGALVLEAHDVAFRYRAGGPAVLHDARLQIRAGDRLLVEGPSGSGKSTLTGLLTGLRRPDAGLLLLRGLDRQSVGLDAWRARVAAAPQFHENHILTGTFAFNVLMGRPWPPTPTDLEDADGLCRALGLGPLLDRMPAGLHQMVGETGWQLSHGERSRLFLARALLQQADLVVLDESFGALDPENLARTLGCVLQRAPTLLVIAHP